MDGDGRKILFSFHIYENSFEEMLKFQQGSSKPKPSIYLSKDKSLRRWLGRLHVDLRSKQYVECGVDVCIPIKYYYGEWGWMQNGGSIGFLSLLSPWSFFILTDIFLFTKVGGLVLGPYPSSSVISLSQEYIKKMKINKVVRVRDAAYYVYVYKVYAYFLLSLPPVLGGRRAEALVFIMHCQRGRESLVSQLIIPHFAHFLSSFSTKVFSLLLFWRLLLSPHGEDSRGGRKKEVLKQSFLQNKNKTSSPVNTGLKNMQTEPISIFKIFSRFSFHWNVCWLMYAFP